MRLAIFAASIAAIPSFALANNDEHVLLCNCSDRKGKGSALMAYYLGDPTGFPAATAIMKTGKNRIWEGAPVSAEFPGGDTFTSTIAVQVPAGTFAGTGKNNLRDLSCYRSKSGVDTVTLMDGTMCSPVYDCNHIPPDTPVPSDQTRIDYTLNGNYIDITGASILDPIPILGTIWSRRNERTFIETDLNIGGGCKITFRGHGDDSWRTTNGLAQILMSQVATQGSLVKRWDTVSNSTYCMDYCGGDECCQYEQVRTPHMKMAESVSIYATNLASKSVRGELSYTMSCISEPSLDCELTKALEADLGDEDLAPEVGLAFLGSGAIIGLC